MTLILAIPFEVRLALLFALGCCAGAAINLGIYRLAWFPRPISPWSRPADEAPRRNIWDRVPVIGWLGLRREAALHGRGFWIRPMLLEIVTGAIFAGLYWWEVGQRGLVPDHLTMLEIVRNLETVRHQQFLAHAVLLSFMLIAFWIDIDEMTIPDGVTIPGTLLGLAIVTLWPYSLLPESPFNCNGPFGLPMATPVWLTSPDEIALPGNPNVLPRFAMPWDSPATTGPAALAAAIAAIWVWCLALAPGRWFTRHGYLRAMRVFTARLVRERTTYALLTLAVIGSLATAWVWWRGGVHWAGLATGLAGIVVGGGLVWIIRILASAVMHREAMGFGDVTLLAMIGAFLGWQATIIVFFLALLVALTFGVGRLILHGEKEIPYGPFLCFATAMVVVFWPRIWDFCGEAYFSQGWRLIAVLLGCLLLIVVLLPPVRWIVGRMRGAGT